MISDFETKRNFWDSYPEFKILMPFSEFYKKDKSKNKSKSSKILWGIALAECHNSNWYNLTNKYDRIKDDFIQEPTLNWEDYQPMIEVFKDTQISQAEKSLTAWNELMHKRDSYLKNQEYYFDQFKIDPKTGDNEYSRTGQPILQKGTAEQLDKAYSTTPKMYADYEKIKKMLAEEKSIVASPDNESLTDQGYL